jgi:hypothetical protein
MMSTIRMSFVSVLFAGLMSVNVSADEPTKEENPVAPVKIEAAEKKALTPNEEALQKIIKGPAGVFDPEYDEDGILLRLKIKGEAAVTRALSAARAERAARDQAQRDAKAAFVKFLKEEVSVRENEQEELIIVEKDGEEQAGYKNVSTRIIETKASGLLRGLIVLDERYKGEGGARTATVVFGWSKKLADAARTAQRDMARDRNPIIVPEPSGNRGETPNSAGDKSRTAGNLTDF